MGRTREGAGALRRGSDAKKAHELRGSNSELTEQGQRLRSGAAGNSGKERPRNLMKLPRNAVGGKVGTSARVLYGRDGSFTKALEFELKCQAS